MIETDLDNFERGLVDFSRLLTLDPISRLHLVQYNVDSIIIKHITCTLALHLLLGIVISAYIV